MVKSEMNRFLYLAYLFTRYPPFRERALLSILYGHVNHVGYESIDQQAKVGCITRRVMSGFYNQERKRKFPSNSAFPPTRWMYREERIRE